MSRSSKRAYRRRTRASLPQRLLRERICEVRETTGLPVFQQNYGDRGDFYHLRMKLRGGGSCRLTPGTMEPEEQAVWLDAFEAGVNWERGLKAFAPEEVREDGID